MTEPEPLPGTHLASTACMYCENPVLAVPENADRAVCAGCGRDEVGAHPPPGVRFPRARHRAATPEPARVQQLLPWTVTCGHCEWTGHVGTATDVWLALRVHNTVAHKADGWVSGVRGGINDPWGRRR
jgi:hypothetical protein